jgi:RNA polymerase sigma factor (sigma-70 family)
LQTVINDTSFITALHEGAPSAYNAIYNHFVDPVRYFVGQIVNDQQAAEDITVEAFTRAFHRRNDFASVEKLRGFLFITAGNAAKDCIRRQKHRDKVLTEIAGFMDNEEENIEAAYIRAEAARAVREAIEHVAGQAGQVVRMLFADGKSLSEVAAELGIAYNTVQNHRAKGLQMIRQHLVANKFLSTASLVIALSFLETS